jgi:hypothetical protein
MFNLPYPVPDEVDAHVRRLILNRRNSIVLPSFDTSSIIGSETNEIILSLFLLEINRPTDKVHVTINPFNPNTKIAEDGLSTFLELKRNGYIDFRLPNELFKKIVGTSKRLLLRLVDPDVELVFTGPDSTGTTEEPKLTIVSSDRISNVSHPQGLIVSDLSFFNVENAQIHFGSGDNIGHDKGANDKEGFWSRSLWPFIIAVIAPIIVALILYHIFGIDTVSSLAPSPLPSIERQP